MTNPKSFYLVDHDNLQELLRQTIKEELASFQKEILRIPKILSREEAAEKLGVSPNTVSGYIKNGKLPNRGIGRRINILESDLDNLPVKKGFSYQNFK